MSENPIAYDRGSHVLVVDDHPHNRQVMIEQLGALGVRSTVVADGFAALEAFEQQSFDLVLMDCHMPGMNGYEATQRIRQRETMLGMQRVPVLAISAAADAAHLRRCMDSGMDSVLKKPLRPGELGATLGLWLHWPIPTQRTLAVAETPPEALLALYKDSFEKDLQKLDDALAQGDRDSTISLAHRIKGAAMMVHADGMMQAAAWLEEMAGCASEPALAQGARRLHKEIADWIAMRRH